jgi:modulator of FtsH protease
MSFEQSMAARSAEASLATNKVIRNTYTLLSLTLLFSALTAGIAMVINPPSFIGLVCSLASLGLVWFVLPRTANSPAGLGVVFAITGLLGFGLGPVLNMYMNMENGDMIIMQALGLTGVVFLGLSAYALTTRKDFSFMRGFLVAGLWVAIIASLIVLGAALFGYPMPGISLGISAMVALLMAGFILYETGEIVNGGQTNYILAAIGLYLSIYNLFVSLLRLLGFANSDD